MGVCASAIRDCQHEGDVQWLRCLRVRLSVAVVVWLGCVVVFLCRCCGATCLSDSVIITRAAGYSKHDG